LPVAIKIPEVGESISEVAIGEWLKHEGDFVERDEDVVVIETDKATVEIPAPESGRVTKILKREGDSASVNEVIAYIDSDAVNDAPKRNAKSNNRAGQRDEAPKKPVGAPDDLAKPTTDQRHTDEMTDSTASSPKTNGEDTSVQPAAAANLEPESDLREKTEEAGTLDSLPAQNRQAFDEPAQTLPHRPMEEHDREPAIAPEKKDRMQSARPTKPVQIRQQTTERQDETVPMSQLRRKIAERLVHAQQNAALLTTFNEIDMSAVIDLRNKHRDAFAQKYDTKLGFMSFFVRAAVEALKLVPEVNAEIHGENIVYHKFFDIGIAVGGGKGLVVPVLRQAERLSFGEIENAIADFARRAEQDKLTPGELHGGTFTISNGGIYGSLLSTPIVNPPQSAILGLHAIQDRPVARQGAVVVRPMMYVALTYDHRIIDGREAVKFLKHIKNLIEEPVRMLLGI